MKIVVRRPRAEDRAEWTRMRVALWPESSAESHAEEVTAFLTGNLTGWLAGLQAAAAFVAVRPAGGLCGTPERVAASSAGACRPCRSTPGCPAREGNGRGSRTDCWCTA